MPPSTKKLRSAPLGRYLASLVAIVTLPILLTALILSYAFISLERDRLQNAAIDTAQEMASLLDNELSIRINVLRALATSPALDTRDFELFQHQAESTGRSMPGVQITLRATDGQELVNSSFAYGNTLAKTQYAIDAQAAEKKQPVIFTPSELQGGKAWAFVLTVPIEKEGQAVYFLDLAADASAAQDMFRNLRIPENWAWGVFDKSFRNIVGTSEDANGILHFASLFDQAKNNAGSYVMTDNTGKEALVAYAKSPLTDWKVAVVVAKQDMEEPLRTTLSALALLFGIIATAAIIAVVAVNSLLRRSVDRLVKNSRELGQKEVVEPVITGVKEFDRVSEAISAAAISLREKSLVIRDSENRIRTLLDNLFVYVGLLDLQGRMIETNAMPLNLAGLTREDVIGRPIWETYWWSWSPHVKELMESAVISAGEGRTSRFEVEMRMSGGALHIIDFQLAPLHDSSGRIVYLLPSAVDITERKALESKLQESLAQIEATYAASSAGLFLMDANLRFAAVNPVFAAISKSSIDEHLGKSLREVIGEDGKQLETQLRKVLKTGKPIAKFEYTMTPNEGESMTRVYRASYYPVLNESGKVQGIAGAVQDITGKQK